MAKTLASILADLRAYGTEEAAAAAASIESYVRVQKARTLYGDLRASALGAAVDAAAVALLALRGGLDETGIEALHRAGLGPEAPLGGCGFPDLVSEVEAMMSEDI